MSDATPWPETVPFPSRPRPDTFAVVMAIEDWRMREPIRRRVVADAHGHRVTATVSLGMGEGEPPATRTVVFARPVPVGVVLSALDDLIELPPNTTVTVPQGEPDR